MTPTLREAIAQLERDVSEKVGTNKHTLVIHNAGKTILALKILLQMDICVEAFGDDTVSGSIAACVEILRMCKEVTCVAGSEIEGFLEVSVKSANELSSHIQQSKPEVARDVSIAQEGKDGDQ